MSASTTVHMGPISNVTEGFMAAEVYNRLPHIDDMRDSAEHNKHALSILLDLIRDNGLSKSFSVHLLHKHFDVPTGHVMVYETKISTDHPTFMILNPRKPQDLPHVRGLYFQAEEGGNMVAYEYTTDIGEDVSAHGEFVKEFSKQCFELGVQRVFALSVRKPRGTVFNEIEWAKAGSTILFPEALWSPKNSVNNKSITTVTDWSPPTKPDVPGVLQLQCVQGLKGTHTEFTETTCSTTRSGQHYSQNMGYPATDSDAPGIVQLKCTVLGSGNHYNFTCSKTRSGTHYEQAVSYDVTASGLPVYFLDNEAIAHGSDMFKILDAAYHTVQAY